MPKDPAMYPAPRSHRPLIMGRNGAVGANHPMAAQAGVDILRAGGNAVDASVAVALMHERHGCLSWAQLVEPAIELAADGSAATHGYRGFAADNRARLAADP